MKSENKSVEQKMRIGQKIVKKLSIFFYEISTYASNSNDELAKRIREFSLFSDISKI